MTPHVTKNMFGMCCCAVFFLPRYRLSSSNWLAIAVLLATEYGLARRRSRTIVAPDTTAILPAKAKGAASSDAPAAAAWPGPSAVPAVDPTTATV